MTPNVYNPKIKNKKLLTILLIVIIAAMFLIRGILYQNGTLEEIQTLEPDELHKRIAQYEVGIINTVSGTGSGIEVSGMQTSKMQTSTAQTSTAQAETEAAEKADTSGTTVIRGSGTVLDGRKQRTSDENYTLTIVTACHVVQEEGTVTVTLPDGSSVEGTVITEDPVQDMAFVQCECPDEIDVYYSRDILERLEADDPVYALKDGNLISGTVVGTKQDLDGVGTNLTVVNLNNEEGMSGAGIYGSSGNYLGMIVQGTADGRTACVSAVDVMKAFNDN